VVSGAFTQKENPHVYKYMPGASDFHMRGYFTFLNADQITRCHCEPLRHICEWLWVCKI